MIDDVMAAIKPEFEEYGVSEEVLAELQNVSSIGHRMFLNKLKIFYVY